MGKQEGFCGKEEINVGVKKENSASLLGINEGGSRTPTALNQEERQSTQTPIKEGASIRVEKMKLFFSVGLAKIIDILNPSSPTSSSLLHFYHAPAKTVNL